MPDEIRPYRFWLIEQANQRAKEAIQKEEDMNIFSALLAASGNGIVSTSTVAASLGIDYEVEAQGLHDALQSLPREPRFIEDSFVTAPAMSYTMGIDPVASFPVRQDITVLPGDDAPNLRLGWRIYEEVGVAVVNDYAISMVNFGEDHVEPDPELEYVPTLREGILTRYTHRYPFGRHLDLWEDNI